jgi:hypothetical protein
VAFDDAHAEAKVRELRRAGKADDPGADDNDVDL